MSAFDDEFGLFGDEDAAAEAEEERRPTLGARKIASSETIIDDIEPEDERPRRRPSGGDRGPRSGGGRRDPERGPRTTADPAAAQARAVGLLDYMARKLVSKPDDVIVELVEGSRGPIIELEVHPDDFGKVIGKGGRVAQALRTLVRAAAEGKVTVDIVDVEDDEVHEQDLEHAEPAALATEAPADEADEAAGALELDAQPGADEPAAEAEPAPAKRKRSPAKAGAKKKHGGSAAAGSRKR